MTPFEELRAELEILRSGWQGSPERFVYRGPADFVLREGVEYPPPPPGLPAPEGAPRMCFGNSIQFAYLFGWSYVEGYALLSGGSSLPIPHAWNLDENGRLVDTTWRIPGRAYVGVVFSVGRADDASWFGDAHVLDDWGRDWPLFREPWTGEDFARVWEPSPVLGLIDLGRVDPDAARAGVAALRAKEGL